MCVALFRCMFGVRIVGFINPISHDTIPLEGFSKREKYLLKNAK